MNKNLQIGQFPIVYFELIKSISLFKGMGKYKLIYIDNIEYLSIIYANNY